MNHREVIFQDYRGIIVATLVETNEGLYFKYDENWKGMTLDPSLPLEFEGILNDWQIDGFFDRLPVKANPNYPIFCKKWGISPDETDLLTLFCTLGHRTTSFTTCRPSNWEPGLWKEIKAEMLRSKVEK